jgi:hypothetical protein
MYEALALGTNCLEVGNNISNVVNFSTISNSMIQGLTNSSQLFSRIIVETNGWAYHYNPVYIIKMLKSDGKFSNLIKELVQSGEVCQVIGHKWQAGCKDGWGCAVIHKEDIQHCAICLIEERRPIN